jgi:ribosome biogenesis protein Nip4
MRPLEHFLIQFGIRRFDKGNNTLFVQDNKYFMISKGIQNIIKKTKKPFYSGTYIGKARGKSFFPSVNLLNMIRKRARNKVWIDEKTAWLFVCGRDIFSEGIQSSTKCVYKGIIALILNKNDEVLGFGKALKGLSEKGVVIQNIFDIGDFLRREKKK